METSEKMQTMEEGIISDKYLVIGYIYQGSRVRYVVPYQAQFELRVVYDPTVSEIVEDTYPGVVNKYHTVWVHSHRMDHRVIAIPYKNGYFCNILQKGLQSLIANSTQVNVPRIINGQRVRHLDYATMRGHFNCTLEDYGVRNISRFDVSPIIFEMMPRNSTEPISLALIPNKTSVSTRNGMRNFSEANSGYNGLSAIGMIAIAEGVISPDDLKLTVEDETTAESYIGGYRNNSSATTSSAVNGGGDTNNATILREEFPNYVMNITIPDNKSVMRIIIPSKYFDLQVAELNARKIFTYERDSITFPNCHNPNCLFKDHGFLHHKYIFKSSSVM